MTTVLTRPAEAPPASAAPASGREPARPRGRGSGAVIQVATGLTVLLVLLLGFAAYLYGLSSLSEHRAQTNLRKTFSHNLVQAIAPVGPVADGTPVAALDIPAIGLHQAVVVEGTSTRDLADGPGHRADTVLPGQTGVSVVYGRRVTFGAPFAHLMRLQVGDVITTVTGQGTARYRVSSFGDAAHPAPANSTNRLVLTTADSSGIPHSTVSVSADLVTSPQPVSGPLPAQSSDEEGMATGVGNSLLPTLLWSQALLVLAVVTTVAMQRWSRTATYLAAAPIALAVLWNLYENVACLLPNLF